MEEKTKTQDLRKPNNLDSTFNPNEIFGWSSPTKLKESRDLNFFANKKVQHKQDSALAVGKEELLSFSNKLTYAEVLYWKPSESFNCANKKPVELQQYDAKGFQKSKIISNNIYIRAYKSVDFHAARRYERELKQILNIVSSSK
eukprot:NODE_28_length_33831_cov_0.361200.p15 type:complete len:144 gc:universal NODE_28_length_33831_cov_0.361200:18855-18424(-)